MNSVKTPKEGESSLRQNLMMPGDRKKAQPNRKKGIHHAIQSKEEFRTP